VVNIGTYYTRLILFDFCVRDTFITIMIWVTQVPIKSSDTLPC